MKRNGFGIEYLCGGKRKINLKEGFTIRQTLKKKTIGCLNFVLEGLLVLKSFI